MSRKNQNIAMYTHARENDYYFFVDFCQHQLKKKKAKQSTHP